MDPSTNSSSSSHMVSEGEVSINQLTIKIPPWFDNVDLWIQQVEAAFASSRPSIKLEKNKYYHVICNLPGYILNLMSDKMDPNSGTPYTTFMEALRKRLSPAQSTTFSSLSNVKLNGRRAYEALREVRERCRLLNVQSDEFMREAFLNAMPASIWSVLRPLSKTQTLDELADTADNILSSTAKDRSLEVCQIASTSCKCDQWKSDIDEIKDQIASLNFNFKCRRLTLCYYHRRFGHNAYKCQSPCDWSKKHNHQKKISSSFSRFQEN